MKLPYTPKAVFNKMGGQIVELTGIKHVLDRPQYGHSRDYWVWLGKVRWDDGKVSTGTIDCGALCAETKEGHDEINDLSGLMVEYLNKHGQWCDSKSGHEGWYAHRKAKAAA